MVSPLAQLYPQPALCCIQGEGTPFLHRHWLVGDPAAQSDATVQAKCLRGRREACGFRTPRVMNDLVIFRCSKSFKYLALKGGDVKYFDKEFVDLPVLHSEILWFSGRAVLSFLERGRPMVSIEVHWSAGHRGCELRSRRRGSPSGREPLRGKTELGNRMEIRSSYTLRITISMGISGSDWLEVPTISTIYKAYVRPM